LFIFCSVPALYLFLTHDITKLWHLLQTEKSLMKRILYLLLLLFPACEIFAQLNSDSLYNGLQTDVFLHPGDQPTGYTLKKHEWIYGQSPTTLPFPSWAMVGLSDKVTMELDLLPFFLGFLTPSHLPMPSTNIRIRLLEQSGIRPESAIEIMAFHLWDTIKRYDDKDLLLRMKGTGAFIRSNNSWEVKSNFYLHTSVGFVYQKDLWMSNKDNANPESVYYNSQITLDYSLGLDWRPYKRISFYVMYAHGSTFSYVENIPHKTQFNYGFRLAPFYKNKHLFFKCMRVEMVALFTNFPDINVKKELALPIYGYIYWQWEHKQKHINNKDK
jgi:hypothetical protein